jgi:uncharacterized membrane protein
MKICFNLLLISICSYSIVTIVYNNNNRSLLTNKVDKRRWLFIIVAGVVF